MSSRPLVLLVDDHAENLLALEAMLACEDCELLEARSGREALELLLQRGEGVALALLDVQMPEMDGFEVAELMRGTERTRSIPIIFITAATRDTSRAFKGYESGAVDFLSKPLDGDMLRSKVGVFLELHRQREELGRRVRELELAEERLREADRRKDDFLAVLSHELRNPLMPIRTSLYLLSQARSEDQIARSIEVIDRQSRHLERLVDDLLDITRVSRGKVELRLEPLDLVASVRRCADDHLASFEHASVELRCDLSPDPLYADADSTRVAQIVGNLLGNAAKFTPPGGRVELAVAQEGDHALVRVRDDGVGMAPEMLGTLFEPFVQADRTLDRSRGGLGLGLALARSLTEMHGGTIEARSAGIGRGSELLVRLPLTDRRAEEAAAPPDDASSSPRRRVLLVEDNQDNAMVLEQAIGHLGHDVAVAVDGPSALATARTFRPQVVVCDIGLPGMDGFEVARRFRADPALAGVVLIALTGYASREDRRAAMEVGFDDHLPKPPDVDRLAALLARLAS